MIAAIKILVFLLNMYEKGHDYDKKTKMVSILSPKKRLAIGVLMKHDSPSFYHIPELENDTYRYVSLYNKCVNMK